MSEFIYKFGTDQPHNWIYKAYYHWRDFVAEDYIPVGFNSSWYHDWFFETYNLKWSYENSTTTIIAEREEDWTRFQLEWM